MTIDLRKTSYIDETVDADALRQLKINNGEVFKVNDKGQVTHESARNNIDKLDLSKVESV